MERNVEIKAKVNNYTECLKEIYKMDIKESKEVQQRDTFYRIKSNKRLKLRTQTDNSTNEEVCYLIHYDRPNMQGPKLSYFTRSYVDKNIGKILAEELGVIGEVVKLRKYFIVGQTRIHLDAVYGLGNFLELEVMLRPDQTPEEGEKIAKDLMKQLGIDEKNLIEGAYMDLLVDTSGVQAPQNNSVNSNNTQ